MKRFISLTVCLFLLVSLCACAPKKDTTSTSATTTTTQTPPTQSTITPPSPGYNVLTGENNMDLDALSRPIGFMVPNDSKTIGNQPQIDKADFYFECETEGAIPRLMTVFSSISRVPENYGPIRSTRTPFVATARSLGLILVHCGGSYSADTLLATGVLDHVDAIKESSSLFWRDKTLKTKIDYVHSLVTSGSKLKDRIEKKNLSLSPIKQVPFAFGDKEGDIKAEKVQLNTTPSHRVTFIYDEASGLYGKSIGAMDSCKPHTSLEGEQIKVSNILVVYGEKYMESEETCNFREGDGNAYLISGGTARKLNFTRTDDSLTFSELDGSSAKFAQGKIYMVLADKTLESKISFAE